MKKWAMCELEYGANTQLKYVNYYIIGKHYYLLDPITVDGL